MRTNFDNKGKSDDEILWFWEDKIKQYGIPVVHPTYTAEEEYVMKFKGAGELRKAEPDLRNEAPHYLILRESMRRYVRDGFTRHNNYAKLIVRAFERLHESLLDSNLELADTFNSRPDAFIPEGGTKIKAGTEINGLYYVPYFRVWRPWEIYAILWPIGKLKYVWNGDTRARGKVVSSTSNELYADAVARIRQEWIESGYVDKIIDRVNALEEMDGLVPIPYLIKNKLATGFKKKRKEPVKEIKTNYTFYPTGNQKPLDISSFKSPIEELSLFQKFLNWFK